MSESGVDRRGFHFELGVNLGHVITIIVVLTGIAVGWGNMNTRLTAQETLTAQHEKLIVELQISNAKLTTLTELLSRRILEDPTK